MKHWINFNGEIKNETKVSISCNNKTFKYGNDFFETMKWMSGNIVLATYHFERMFETLNALQCKLSSKFNYLYFIESIKELIQKNNIQKAARIRITFFSNDGGIFDGLSEEINFIIQVWNLEEEKYTLNDNGLELGIFKNAYKAVDSFSKYKLNNSYPYSIAANWSRLNQLNDSVILNTNMNISDTCIANIFCIQNGIIKTPSLQDGCIDGVMRRFIIEQLNKHSIPIEIGSITQNDLLNSQEIFTTNVIKGIRWVKKIDDTHFKLKQIIELEKLLMKEFYI
jgi:branched-subunit amino acid aminotransferase/4-amino-4-deoxychorismate lyase